MKTAKAVRTKSMFRRATVAAAATTIAFVSAGLACGARSHPGSATGGGASILFFNETFEHPTTISRTWVAAIPEVAGATVLFDAGDAHLVLPSNGTIELRHAIDPWAVRGKRIRVSARMHSDAQNASARITLSMGSAVASREGVVPFVAAPPGIWSSCSATFLVAADIVRTELSLTLQGQGNAWFDDVKIEILDQAPITGGASLSSQQLENVEALARASALIQYRHPSDQVMVLNWATFLPWAMERVLLATDRDSLLRTLRVIFRDIAPTVEFNSQSVSSPREPPRTDGGHLTRWRHIGLGPGGPYSSWREGRDKDLGDVRVETKIDRRRLSGCNKLQLRAAVRDVGSDGEAHIYADVEQSGEAAAHFYKKMSTGDSLVVVDGDMPADAHDVRVGLQLSGRADATIEALNLTCDGRDKMTIDIEHELLLHRGTESLYSYTWHNCGSGQHRHCLAVRRRPLDTTFDPARDILNVAIGDHLWMYVPLALWSDGMKTQPSGVPTTSALSETVSDISTQVATIAQAWGVLWLFYPYFHDQQIDWVQELRPAIKDAASAQGIADTYTVLFRLLAKLHDNHARAMHPAVLVNGALPVALRRFDNKLAIVGALEQYSAVLPIGAEVLMIDGLPALQAYDGMRERISAATPGWSDFIVPFWMTVGPLGTFATLRLRPRGHDETDVVLPRLSRALYDAIIREPRPSSGTEIAPGMRYVDLDGMKLPHWQSILPALTEAKTVIMDMRGYPTNTVFTVLGHLTDREVHSPVLQQPLLETGQYQTASFNIRPIAPRLGGKLIVLVDGRAGSAAETFLQMIHDNHLAILIGETSAGTNGNVKIVSLPDGFSIRFTGMRVLLSDGTALQGKGIVPDLIVHPTLEGVRTGHDEILEAAITYARKM